MNFGVLCVVSNICGCLGFVRQVCQGELPSNLIVADYTSLPEGMAVGDFQVAQVLGKPERDLIETNQAKKVAQEIIDRLPTTKRARQAFLKRGHLISQKMSWDVVVQNYLLPALVQAASK